jgi:hypothetical protein
MKYTKTFLLVVASAVISYMCIAFAVYLLSDMTYKESCTYGGTLFATILFGWILPCMVLLDLDEQ